MAGLLTRFAMSILRNFLKTSTFKVDSEMFGKVWFVLYTVVLYEKLCKHDWSQMCIVHNVNRVDNTSPIYEGG